MVDNIKKRLKGAFVFSLFENKELDKIAEFSTVSTFKKNEEVFADGDEAENFFVVIEGAVKIYKGSSEGKEQTLHIQKKGDLVAEAAIFDIETYPANCKAIEKSKLIKVSKKEFLKFLINNPEVSIKLLSSYSRRLRSFVSLVENLSLNDVKRRFAKYLIENACDINGIKMFEISLPKKELSALLGISPESLSRVILSFKKEGFIKDSQNKRFELNVDALKAILS